MGIPPQDVERWLGRVHERHIQVPFLARRVFETDQRALLMMCYLISLREIYRATERNGGWFFRSEEMIQGDLGFERTKQHRALKTLKDMDLIDIKRPGWSGCRHFKINQIRWQQELDKHEEAYRRDIEVGVRANQKYLAQLRQDPELQQWWKEQSTSGAGDWWDD